MNTSKITGIFIAVAVLAFGGMAGAQEADLPFYSGVSVSPNIMLMIDTSGSMDWSGGPGVTRMDVVKNVLIGDGEKVVQYNGETVYLPHHDVDLDRHCLGFSPHLSGCGLLDGPGRHRPRDHRGSEEAFGGCRRC